MSDSFRYNRELDNSDHSSSKKRFIKSKKKKLKKQRHFKQIKMELKTKSIF